MLDEAEDRKPLVERELRGRCVRAEAEVVREPSRLARRDVGAQRERDVAAAVTEAGADERAVGRHVLGREERALAPDQTEDDALDARRRREVAPAQGSLDAELPRWLVEQREERLMRSAGELPGRLALDDEQGCIRRARGVQQAAHQRRGDGVRDVRDDAPRRAWQRARERVAEHARDVRVAGEPVVEDREEMRVLLDRLHSIAGGGERPREGAVAGARLEDEAAGREAGRTRDRAGGAVAQEVLREAGIADAGRRVDATHDGPPLREASRSPKRGQLRHARQCDAASRHYSS